MSSTHVDALERKLTQLDKKIHDEMCHLSSDDQEIRRMKKERLHIEEEIEKFRD